MGKFQDLMDADLEIRGYAPSTRKYYLLAVREFIAHFMRPPDEFVQGISRVEETSLRRT